MRSIPVWSITEASYPERDSQLQTTYSPKMPTIFVWRVPFSTLRLMVAPCYRELGPLCSAARHERSVAQRGPHLSQPGHSRSEAAVKGDRREPRQRACPL